MVEFWMNSAIPCADLNSGKMILFSTSLHNFLMACGIKNLKTSMESCNILDSKTKYPFSTVSISEEL